MNKRLIQCGPGLPASTVRVGRKAAAYAEIFSLYEAGKLHAAKIQRFPLDHFAEALDRLVARQIDGRAILAVKP